jgi:hypothetical protein
VAESWRPVSDSIANGPGPLLRIRATRVQRRNTTAVKLIAETSQSIKSSNDMRQYLSFFHRDASHTGTRSLQEYPSEINTQSNGFSPWVFENLFISG